jgi:cell division protease FtsH
MSPEVGQAVYERPQQQFLDLPGGMQLERGLSDDTARRIDAAVRALVDEAFVRASAVLSERRTLLEQGAEQLLAQETLTEADLQPLFDAARQRPAPP